MNLLEGKVAIVTGSGAGIGRSIVVELARHGAKVVASGRSKSDLDATVAEASQFGEAVAQASDVTNEQQLNQLVADTVERFGPVTTFVNNAGVLRPGTVLDATLEDYELQMDVNVKGVFLGARAVLPTMLNNGGGSIINIGSINSVVAESQLAIYTASKGATLMLTKAIATDYAADGVRCNCVCPGFVDTKLNVPHYELLGGREALEEALPSFQPIGRAIEASEIAGAVVYLASDLSSAVTGTAQLVDGGVTMKA
jgi:meso-butanediol dehydrogenase / (S,S)-butanediol dehydrogenase / diacetyl reductase